MPAGRKPMGIEQDTSGNASTRGTLGRIAELEELLAQTRWELRTAKLREELATLGLSRPKVAGKAQKKTRLPGGRPHGERGGRDERDESAVRLEHEITAGVSEGENVVESVEISIEDATVFSCMVQSMEKRFDSMVVR